MVFGASKLHIEMGTRPNLNSRKIGSFALQFNLKQQESKIDLDSSTKFESMVDSMLDESFFRHHV